MKEEAKGMEKKWNGLKLVVVTMVLAMILAGCASLQKNNATDVEGLLTQAGFQKMVAGTPEKLAHLQTLAQRKFSRHKRHGKIYFVYADDTYCKCLFSGDDTAMRHYRDLEVQQDANPIEMDRPDIVTGEQWSRSPWGPFN